MIPLVAALLISLLAGLGTAFGLLLVWTWFERRGGIRFG